MQDNYNNSPSIAMATHAKPSLLLPFNQDNLANMTTATHAHLLLPSIQDNLLPMITAACAKLLLLHCIQDTPAIMLAPFSNFSLQLTVEIPRFSLLHDFKCPAIMTELNGQNLLLLCVQDNLASMIVMATHIELLLLHCVQDYPEIMMATNAKLKLQLIVASIQTQSTISTQEKIIVVLHSEGESDDCRLIVESNFEGVQAYDITQDFISGLCHCPYRCRCPI